VKPGYYICLKNFPTFTENICTVAAALQTYILLFVFLKISYD